MTYHDNDRIRTEAELMRRGGSGGRGGIIFGAVLLAMILGAVFFLPASDTNTASNQSGTTVSSPARVAPSASTTGSGATSPPAAVPATPTIPR